jgi:glycosyltransferase involved in cell wall biosynthesis
VLPSWRQRAKSFGRGWRGGKDRASENQRKTMTLPFSIFVITRNEEARIGRTLGALRGLTDDIVVVDSGSSDQTVAIAEAHGARVMYRAWEGYGQQKRFAESQCRHDWLLNVDADEVVTAELASELRALLAGAPPPGAYNIHILTVYPGDARPRPYPRDVNAVRFYHRSIGSYRDHPSYDRVELAAGVRPGQLQAPLWHYPLVDWHGLIDKANRFSSFQASVPSRHSDAALKFRLYSEFPINFFKTYIVRRHFTGGWKGFYFALAQAFMRTSRIAKMLEARQASAPSAGSAEGKQ